MRVRRDLGENSVAGLTYTDRIEGNAYNRLLEGDAHIIFAKLYFVEAQYGQSWTSLGDGTATATDPIWKLTFDRTGRTWGFNYTINGIGTDFIAGSGFVPRNDIVTAHIFNRLSFYGAKGALLENFTVFFGPTWLYSYRGFGSDSPVEGNQDATFQFTLRGGWQLSAKAARAFVSFDPDVYDVFETAPGVAFVPPSGLDNLYTGEFSATTPTYQLFNASASYEFGHVPLFAEASEGQGAWVGASINFRPSKTLRLEGRVAYATLNRASDGSEFANSVIPRFKVESSPRCRSSSGSSPNTSPPAAPNCGIRSPARSCSSAGCRRLRFDDQGVPLRLPCLLRTEPGHRRLPRLRFGRHHDRGLGLLDPRAADRWLLPETGLPLPPVGRRRRGARAGRALAPPTVSPQHTDESFSRLSGGFVRRSTILGTGFCRSGPHRHQRRLGRPDGHRRQWIRERTGIEQRHWVREGETSVDLAPP